LSTIGDSKRLNILRYDYTLNFADAPKAQSASFMWPAKAKPACTTVNVYLLKRQSIYHKSFRSYPFIHPEPWTAGGTPL
jgi:hypothetical protein